METLTAGSSMPAERQIDCVLKEGMGNIVLAVMGIADLGFDEFIYEPVSTTEEGAVTTYSVRAKVTDQIAQLPFSAMVPVRHPDDQFLLYRIDDVVFEVDAGRNRKYEAWCEHNPYVGAIAIVRNADEVGVTWTVVGTLDDCIFHMARPFLQLESRYKTIIRNHWSNLDVA